MSQELISMLITFYGIITLIVVIVAIVFVRKNIRKLYNDTLLELERNKNLIINASILSELNKVETLINNKELEERFNYWKSVLKELKEVDVPKITDSLLTVDEDIGFKNYVIYNRRLAEVEFDIYMAKSKSGNLLEEIKEITTSESKNREIVTKLKTEYRSLFLQYNNNDKEDYELIINPIELQFENIDKLFSAFEIAMENNCYSEVGKIVKALDDTIGNLKIVIEEAPSIILMGKKMIPNKIKEITKISDKLLSEGYNLDYLKIDYNISESQKKVADVFDRLNVLNLEDSVFELKTILDYFDKLYSSFDKEKIAKKVFDEYVRSVLIKCKKLKKIANSLSNKIDDIKYSYDLTDDDVKIISDINKSIDECKNEYDEVVNNYREKNSPYSILTNNMEIINAKLLRTEDKLDYTLRSIGSLKEDEIRAREQLDEIKTIIKQAKSHINSYKLPVRPKLFEIQMEEASEAIGALVEELNTKPISIKNLNLKVDVARDLVLKVFNTSIETVKTAIMAENAIVFGNRYRSINSNIDSNLSKSEKEFYKGNFKSSLEYAINSINVIEPGIYDRLLETYKKENR